MLLFLAVASRFVRATSWVSVIALVSYYHNVICNNYDLIYLTKVLVKLPLEHISCDCDSKWHYCVSIPAKLCIKGS